VAWVEIGARTRSGGLGGGMGVRGAGPHTGSPAGAPDGFVAGAVRRRAGTPLGGFPRRRRRDRRALSGAFPRKRGDDL